VQALESIAGATGATTLAAHHTTKASRARGATVDGTAGRGSSALFDGTRWQCSLASEPLKHDDSDTRERLGEVVTFTVSKSNYGRKPDPIVLRRDLDNGGALVPLDEADLETTKNARGRDPARETKQAAKEAELAAREAAEDAHVDRIVVARPGIPKRDLVTAIQAAARCGKDRALVVWSRASARLDIRPGPRAAQLHYPKAQP
jgi:RecA-family ATPase